MVFCALFFSFSLVLQQPAGPLLPPDENGKGAVGVSSLELLPTPGFSSAGSGTSIAALGDFDADGLQELAVGAPGPGAGFVYFFEQAGQSGRPHHRIGEDIAGFGGSLRNTDAFGSALASLDDLDGDGIRELAVGAPGDDDGNEAGAVWILFLDRYGDVRHEVKISMVAGGFTGLLHPEDRFGGSLGVADDLDGDGLRELLVGAPLDDDGGQDQGAVWVLFLGADGQVRTQQKISASAGSFSGDLDAFDLFGESVAGLGDLDGDGRGEIAVGAPNDDDVGGMNDNYGAVWILFPDATGVVTAEQKIGRSSGGLSWPLQLGDHLGYGLTSLGDVDGDGRDDLVAGASGTEGATTNEGLVLHLFLNADGTVHGNVELGTGLGNFGGTVEPGDFFGFSVAPIGDLNLDGRTDLAVGAPGADAGGAGNIGEFWTIAIAAGGLALAETKVGAGPQSYDSADAYGQALAGLGDLSGDGTLEAAVSMPGSIGFLRYFWILSLAMDGSVAAASAFTINGVQDQGFASALTSPGDLDGDGTPELVAGAPLDRSGDGFVGPRTGGLWTLFLSPDGSVQNKVETDGGSPALTGLLAGGDRFGASLAPIGDLDGDGVEDLAVGAPGDDDGLQDAGAVYLAFLEANGSVREVAKISATSGGFTGPIGAFDAFGESLAALGDLDGNGVCDLAVGAPQADLPFSPDVGKVWILFLDDDGTVMARRLITSHSSGFDVALWERDEFGRGLALVGDVDGDGHPELAVGAPGEDDGRDDAGAVWLLSLRANGRVRRAVEISAEHGLDVSLLRGDRFGESLGALGDVNQDGVPDLGVGAPDSDWLGRDAGRAWILLF